MRPLRFWQHLAGGSAETPSGPRLGRGGDHWRDQVVHLSRERGVRGEARHRDASIGRPGAAGRPVQLSPAQLQQRQRWCDTAQHPPSRGPRRTAAGGWRPAHRSGWAPACRAAWRGGEQEDRCGRSDAAARAKQAASGAGAQRRAALAAGLQLPALSPAAHGGTAGQRRGVRQHGLVRYPAALHVGCRRGWQQHDMT